MRSDQLAGGAFVHGEEVAIHPVPVVAAGGVVHSYDDAHLRTSPPPGPVRPSHFDVWAKIGQFKLSIGAVKHDARLVHAVCHAFGGEIKSHAPGGSHSVFCPARGPLASGTAECARRISAVVWRVLRECSNRAQRQKPEYPAGDAATYGRTDQYSSLEFIPHVHFDKAPRTRCQQGIDEPHVNINPELRESCGQISASLVLPPEVALASGYRGMVPYARMAIEPTNEPLPELLRRGVDCATVICVRYFP